MLSCLANSPERADGGYKIFSIYRITIDDEDGTLDTDVLDQLVEGATGTTEFLYWDSHMNYPMTL